MKQILKSILSDVDGQTSSKRVITILAFLMMCVGFIASTFGNVTVEEFIWDGMLYIVATGLGFTTIEKFSRKKED
jgi:hypothetical protein